MSGRAPTAPLPLDQCYRCGEPVTVDHRYCARCGYGGPSTMRRWIVPVAAVAILAVIAIWSTGAFDKPLSSVGLNRHPCVRNLLGATFCGDDARVVCARFGGEGCRRVGYPSDWP